MSNTNTRPKLLEKQLFSHQTKEKWSLEIDEIRPKKNQKSDISIHWGSGHPISEGNIVYWISQPQNTDNLKSGVYRYYCYAKVQCSARSGKTRF